MVSGTRDNGDLTGRASEVAAARPVFALLRGYWEGLRDGAPFPPRSAIDPRGLAPILEHTLLIERIAPGLARIRLAGGAVCDLMGMDLRGMPLSALILPRDRDQAAVAVEGVFGGAIVDLVLEAERAIGRSPLFARLLLLPVTGRSGLPDRAIGALVATGKPGRTPRRFALVQTRGLPTGGGAEAPVPASRMPGMAEAPAHFAPAPHAKAPYLRVVK